MTETTRLTLDALLNKGHLSVASVLENFMPHSVFSIPMEGNNGDDLIQLGCAEAFRRHDITCIDTPELANVIIFRGGGAIGDFSQAGVGALQHYCTKFPDKPIIVLPQSFSFEKTNIAPFFATRTAPALLFAREQRSFDLLNDLALPDNVHIASDHDMAIQLMESSWLTKLRTSCRQEYILIVERGDAESKTNRKQQAIKGGPLKQLVPPSWKLPLKRWLRHKYMWRSQLESTFEKSTYSQVVKERPELSSLRVVCSDVSDRSAASFPTFCSTIANAAAVVSNRLHVGVLAAMLGKPTYMCAASYHKVQGVYNYSFADWEHVRLIEGI